jgi:ATP-dependent RNA helicase RhlE
VAITFINEQDQEKFQKIEELIDMQLVKLPTPSSIGESPEYAPRKKKSFKRKYLQT